MAKVRIEDMVANPCRLAFTQFLFEAGTVGGEGKPAFSCTAIIPKTHPAVKLLNAAEEQAAKEKWGEKAAVNLKAIRAAGKGVVKDGDLKASYAGFEGNAFVSLRAEKRPNVYDSDLSQLTAADGKVYAGCHGHVVLDVWAQDNQYGKRLNAQLAGVMFSREGDAFGSGGTPATTDDFADLSADSLVD